MAQAIPVVIKNTLERKPNDYEYYITIHEWEYTSSKSSHD